MTKQQMLLSLPLEFLLGFAVDAKMLRSIWVNYTKKELVHRLVRTLREDYCHMLKLEYDANGRFDETVRQILREQPTANEMRNAFIKKELQKNNCVLVKELRLNGTRVDIASFNGSSLAYEIKSNRDKLDRLQNQILIYSRVFEYVHLVLDRLSPENIPAHVGIYQLNRNEDGLEFEKIREPLHNDLIDPLEQLKLLRLSELRRLTKKYGGKAFARSTTIRFLRSRLDRNEINCLYKTEMKQRYLRTEKYPYFRHNFNSYLDSCLTRAEVQDSKSRAG